MHHRSFNTVAALAATLCLAVAPLVASVAAATAGPEAFNNNCRTCHSAKPGDNRQGPTLNKVIGRKAATAPGYASYSGSLKSSGITWDEATLDRFIANPEAVVPNNNMKPFQGIHDAAVREKIIAYLKSAP